MEITRKLRVGNLVIGGGEFTLSLIGRLRQSLD